MEQSKRYNHIFDSLKNCKQYQTSENHSYKTISRLDGGMNRWIVVMDKTSEDLWPNGIGLDEFFRLGSNHE